MAIADLEGNVAELVTLLNADVPHHVLVLATLPQELHLPGDGEEEGQDPLGSHLAIVKLSLTHEARRFREG